MLSAQTKGALLSLEALLSLLAAVSLLALLPITSHPQPSEYLRVYEYQVLQDVMELMAKDNGLRDASELWLSGGGEANLTQQLEPIMAGVGFCLKLEAEGTSPEQIYSQGGCQNLDPSDPVSTTRIIQLKRVRATLWKS